MDKAYLVDYPSIRCWDTHEHREIIKISSVLIAIWPIGTVLSFGILLAICRKVGRELPTRRFFFSHIPMLTLMIA